MLEKSVLAALLREDAWVTYGSLFDTHFFSTDTYRQLFAIIKSIWSGYEGESDTIPLDLLNAKIEAETVVPEQESSLKRTAALLYEVDLDRSMLDGLVKDVLSRWRTKDYLVSAAQELETGTLDLYSLSARFLSLAKATEAEKEEEGSLITDAQRILAVEDAGLVYPTGLEALDNQLRGGLWASEEGVLIAPSHRGKTWALVHLGAMSLKAGTPVQHYSGEISRARVAIRYYQNLLGWDRIRVLRNKEQVTAKLEEMNLPLWSVRDLSGGGHTTAHIRKSVGEFVERCSTPPLIVVDYLDLISPANRQLEGRHALTAVAQELREIAAEFGIGVWTATQANRPSWSSSHIRMSDVSEAIGKVEKADVVITMNQTTEEFREGIMRFYIDKARERVLSQHEVPALALREEQQFANLPDGLEEWDGRTG